MFIESYKNLKHIFDNEDNALNYLIENKYVNTFDKCGICNYDMKLNFKKKLYVCKAPSSFITSSLQIDKNTKTVANLAKRKYNKGHSVEGAWVIGGIQRKPIEERNIENINEIIEKYIKKAQIPQGVHTNTIEGTWNGLKQSIIPRNRNKKDIVLYSREYL
ncbi:hypothetical protein EDC94DRAFT_591109 [Helicostylum pulchrum]|nr:hypothetical protein EDC94DRAFT_591109 [Helicostylum pulchrum]